MPSWVVMKISLIAFSASATANATASELRHTSGRPVEPQRRDDRNDVLRQQRLQQRGVHALDLAGEQIVHALDDAQRMRDDDVGARGAEIVGGKAFENFVRQPVRGGERDFKRGGVGIRSRPDWTA